MIKTQSLFFKLGLVFSLSFVVIIVVVGGLLKSLLSANDVNQLIQNKSRARYALLLAEKIGYPPQLDQAQTLSQELDIQIEVYNPKVSSTLSTFPPVSSFAPSSLIPPSGAPTIAQLKLGSRHCPSAPGVYLGKKDGRVFALVEKADVIYLFFFKCDAFVQGPIELIPVLVGVVLTLLLGCYLWVRWLLQPLSLLADGVQKVGAGDFSQPVLLRSRSRPSSMKTSGESFGDELTQLTQSFNFMVGQIHEMIQSKEQLLYDVSHELRSPITRMKMALELNGNRTLEIIQKNVLVLEEMVNGILETARLKRTLQLQSVDLVWLVRETVEPYVDDRPGVRLNIYTENLKEMSLDKQRLTTVIKNLIENALKYSSDQERPVEVSLSRSEQSQWILLQIKDYGYGIPKEDCHRIFEPFYRVDKSRGRSTGGFGLGLNICQRIIAAHGGQISVTSSLDEGTTISVALPA